MNTRYGIAIFSVLVMAALLALSLACGAEATLTPAAAPTVARPIPTTAPTPTPRLGPTVAPTATSVALIQPRRGGTLRVAGIQTGFAIKTLDPHYSVQSDEFQLLFVLYNNIVKLGPNLDIQPDLAQSWDVSADGRAITFKLAKGVKFHDGTDLTAEAVKWNMERILDPKGGSSSTSLLAGTGLERIDVVDTTTITFRLKQAFRPFLATLTDRPGLIVSPTAAQKYPAGPVGEFGRNPVGTGPFRLKQWVPEGDITVERFDNYWESGKPYLDGIRFLNVPEVSSQLAVLRTGESDMDQIRQVDLPLAQANPNLKVVEHQSGAYYGLQISMWQEPWTNKALRQAIAYGVDREAVCKAYFGGLCRPAYTPEGIGWVYNPDIKTYPYDPAKAKAKLVEAGYPSGITLPIWFAPINADYGELMQAMLAPLGIKLEVVRITQQDWFDLRARKQSHFMYASWFPRADPHNRLSILHHSKGWANTTGYNDPETDRLIDQAAQEYDIAKAKKLYNEVQRRVTESAHIQYHVYTNVFMGMSKRAQGFQWIPDLFPRLKDVWLSQ